MPKRPSFAGLRAFETVARAGSITAAAELLHITAAGVSHRIRDLETYLEVALFDRSGGRYQLTTEGEILFHYASEGLALISRGLNEINASLHQSEVTLAAPSGLVNLFLMPRLGTFYEQEPSIRIAIEGYSHISSQDTSRVDIIIRRRAEGQLEVSERILFSEVIIPVATPAYFTEIQALDPQDPGIRYIVLKTGLDEEQHPGWDEWFEQQGIAPPAISTDWHFNESQSAIHHAIEHGGVVLANQMHVADFIRQGRLVVCWDIPLETNHHFTMFTRDAALKKPSVRKLNDWLLAQTISSSVEA